MAERARRFQIHDGTFGRALYERDTAIDALLDYFADRRRGEIRSVSYDEATDVATVTVDGVTYTAAEMQLGNVVAALEAEYAELKAALAEARGG